MATLRYDLYSGFAEDRSFTEHDTWLQMEGESLEDLAQRIYDMVIDNGEQLLNDEGDGEDD